MNNAPTAIAYPRVLLHRVVPPMFDMEGAVRVRMVQCVPEGGFCIELSDSVDQMCQPVWQRLGDYKSQLLPVILGEAFGRAMVDGTLFAATNAASDPGTISHHLRGPEVCGTPSGQTGFWFNNPYGYRDVVAIDGVDSIKVDGSKVLLDDDVLETCHAEGALKEALADYLDDEEDGEPRMAGAVPEGQSTVAQALSEAAEQVGVKVSTEPPSQQEF